MLKPGRLFAAALAAALLWSHAAEAAEGSRQLLPAAKAETGRLSIHAATDLEAMEPLLRDFQQLWPGIAVEYVEYVTNDLQRAALAACEAKAVLGDIFLSSSVDQLVRLANDGCALPHLSEQTRRAADWANWRNEVFGFTFEPAVFVYNARLVPPQDVPRTHIELADLLRTKLERYRGRVGTYDIRLSGIGYLLAFNDFRQTTTTFGRLLESMGRASVVVRCCTGAVLREVAEGKLAIGYNMLGSYAYGFSLKHPELRIVVPRDYALVISRGALIARSAPRPDLAALFMDYLLSDRGQATASRASFFFSRDGNVPLGVDSPMWLMDAGVARPIRIGPALLAAQDEAQRSRFIEDWSRSMIDVAGERPATAPEAPPE
jgi:iron(III) transport system substrate-binding protein